MKNKKVIFFSFLLLILTILFPAGVYAAPINKATYCQINDDYYIETTIQDADPTNHVSLNTPSLHSAGKTITKTKTTKICAKDGSVLWSVSIKATFSYNGSFSKCTSYSHSASAPAKTWKIKSVSSSKSSNSATAVAVATHSYGLISKDFKQSVTIRCSKNGVIS